LLNQPADTVHSYEVDVGWCESDACLCGCLASADMVWVSVS